MTVDLDPDRIRDVCDKNAGDGYGLTIVVGLPFPAEITDAVAGIQRGIEALLPKRFHWYGLDHLHVSIYAPLRSQDRPLRRDDLPLDLDGFLRDLGDVISHWQPFPLALAGIQLGPDGALIGVEDSLERRLVSRLGCHPKAATLKYARGLATVIGFLTTAEPFSSEGDRESFERGLAGLRDFPIGTMEVDRVWLVSYDHRTLSRVRGKVEYGLGRAPAALSGTELLAALGIDA